MLLCLEVLFQGMSINESTSLSGLHCMGRMPTGRKKVHL